MNLNLKISLFLAYSVQSATIVKRNVKGLTGMQMTLIGVGLLVLFSMGLIVLAVKYLKNEKNSKRCEVRPDKKVANSASESLSETLSPISCQVLTSPPYKPRKESFMPPSRALPPSPIIQSSCSPSPSAVSNQSILSFDDPQFNTLKRIASIPLESRV